MLSSEDKTKPGPKEDRVKINIDWEDAVGKAIKKKRPEGGWSDDKQDKKKDSE